MSVVYKTDEEVELVRISSLLVGKTLGEVALKIKPGVKTQDLDKLAEEFIRDNDAVPSFKGYGGFSGSLCISINEEVVHGIPGKREIKDGDLLSIDCGVFKNQYHGDSAFTFAVGEIPEEKQKLMRVTMKCLNLAIEKAVEGNKLGDVSSVVQEYAEKNNYGVVRELVGHGIGRNLHEKPEVPNFGRKGSGIVLKSGLIIAIEPMINMGRRNVKQLSDGWTIITSDKKPSAHYEHTVAVGKKEADVLSTFEYIKKSIKKNKELLEIFN